MNMQNFISMKGRGLRVKQRNEERNMVSNLNTCKWIIFMINIKIKRHP